jgi:hypothetical protein
VTGLLAFVVSGRRSRAGSSTESFGTFVPVSGGFDAFATRAVSCVDATDCKVGDLVTVPTGDETNMSKWTFSKGVVPAKDNAGTIISLVRNGSGWDALTKTGDIFGGTTIEELARTSTSGSTWLPTGKTWPATTVGNCSAGSGFCTYSVQVQPDNAPSGQVGLTYAENDASWYGLHWRNVTL